MKAVCCSLVFVSLVAGASSAAETLDAAHFWPQWRGPLATGVAPHANPPMNWSEEENIKWKVSLPGHGHATPIIWGDHIYLTAAQPYGEKVEPVHNNAEGAHDNLPVSQHHNFLVLALSRTDGRILWRTTVTKVFPHEGGHNTGSLASNSPVTDGKNVYAFFGSRGLYGLEARSGKVLWKRDLGRMDTRHAHGEGASPALHGDVLVVNWDHQGDSFVTALDKNTGKTLWKQPRDEMTSWSTPLIVMHEGTPQVVISATKRIRSYALKTGKLVWECGGLTRNVVATPVAGNGLVFAANSYDRQDMLAIRLKGSRGDITGTDQVVWTLKRLTPYVPSPLLYEDTLYFLRHNQGILSCVNPETGKARHGPFRLDGIRNVFASPVAAANRVYIVDRSGFTLVFEHKPMPRPLALNRLDDSFSASPVPAGSELYLRGDKHFYCIAEAP